MKQFDYRAKLFVIVLLVSPVAGCGLFRATPISRDEQIARYTEEIEGDRIDLAKARAVLTSRLDEVQRAQETASKAERDRVKAEEARTRAADAVRNLELELREKETALRELMSQEMARKRVALALHDDPRIDASRIDVGFTENAVVLEGEVPSDDDLNLTLEIAGEVPGVSRLISKLRVVPPVPTLPGASDSTGAAPPESAR